MAVYLVMVIKMGLQTAGIKVW